MMMIDTRATYTTPDYQHPPQKPEYNPAEWQTLCDLVNWIEHLLGRQKVFYSRTEGPLTKLDQVVRALETGQLCSRQEWQNITQGVEPPERIET